MTGKTIYRNIPIITKLFNIDFYLYCRNDKFNSFGFKKQRRMSLEDCISRLETKRIRQEQYSNGSIFPPKL